MVTPNSMLIPINLLDFDMENPRFFDVSSAIPLSDEKSIIRMMEEENLDELVGSIGNQGFFPGEPLLITPNPQSPGRYIVVEGNRRLAALRALGGLIPRGNLTQTIADAVDQAKFKPTEVDCFSFSKRRDILKYLGFRHISGPRRWEPLSKARYLADLIRTFYKDLSQEEQLRAVARDIGSRKSYVAQLLTALNLYDRAKAANFYGLQRVEEKDINFSLLSTALSYNNIVNFLNLSDRESINVDSVNDSHAKELLGWMFAQDQQGNTILGESRRLKTLAAVVASSTAVFELRKNNNLDQAFIYTSGPTETFAKILEGIESSISESIRLLGGEINLDSSHIAQVDRICDKAENLQLIIKNAINKKQKRDRLANAESARNV